MVLGMMSFVMLLWLKEKRKYHLVQALDGGTTLLPGQNITIDDMYSQTSMNYPEVYRMEMSGKMIKDVLEDVCDNIFNTDPFFQQGGDMVRVGGLRYTCSPKNKMGNRINDIELLSTGDLLESNKNYIVGGWGSINPNVKGPKIFNLLENYISKSKLVRPKTKNNIKILGMWNFANTYKI